MELRTNGGWGSGQRRKRQGNRNRTKGTKQLENLSERTGHAPEQPASGAARPSARRGRSSAHRQGLWRRREVRLAVARACVAAARTRSGRGNRWRPAPARCWRRACAQPVRPPRRADPTGRRASAPGATTAATCPWTPRRWGSPAPTWAARTASTAATQPSPPPAAQETHHQKLRH
uniref:Uncharacterized protein n=1 Tax=Zea mays TaxID=4577 RepID=B6SWC2_MAIZE|nr:hypothetical protein [Zea mays]